MFVGSCADAAQTCLNSSCREKKNQLIYLFFFTFYSFLLRRCLFVSGAQTRSAGAKGEVMAAVVTKEPLPERGREVCLIREFREEALQPDSRFLNDDVITSSSTSSCPFYPVEVDNTSALTSPDKRDHFWEVRTFQLVLKRPLEA